MMMLPLLDWLGLAGWLLLWLGYQWFATQPRAGRESLTSMMVPIRRKWMAEALHRENRISDASLIGNLMHSATFFSSTTLLVLGALFAFVSSLDKNAGLVSNLPFAQTVDLQTLEFKVLVLAFVLIYALFRFLWSIRQFNLLTIMLGAYPAATLPSQKTSRAPLHIVAQATRLNALAGNSFAQALRAYYYAVPILLWLISPWLLLAASIGVTSAVYYTEYRSETALALRDAEDEDAGTAAGNHPATTP
jgi:uncharacterized membrane protein